MVNPVERDADDHTDRESCDSSAYPTYRVTPAQVYMAGTTYTGVIDKGTNGTAPEGTAPGARMTIQISEAAMNKARAAIRGGIPMPEDASREDLMAYHHALHQAHTQLQQTRLELDERRRRL